MKKMRAKHVKKPENAVGVESEDDAIVAVPLQRNKSVEEMKKKREKERDRRLMWGFGFIETEHREETGHGYSAWAPHFLFYF